VDYILTVAVSVSAGTDAITSAFQSLHPYSVQIAVFLVLIITILNLRGLTESANVLAYPVYLFVFALIVIIVVGLFKTVTGQVPQNLHPHIGTPVAGISLFLLLKAFSSGCSALTGVEAISNAIPNFRDPAPRNAARTLAMMGIILASLLAGISFLAYWLGIAPKETETVVSQMAHRTLGNGVLYYFVQATTALILVLAANTGFSAFPQLAFNLARDKFMPRMFTIRGDRLGYSNGIIFLGVASMILIVAFQGNTERLIPLYAVGVFIPFTLAQCGMIVKWVTQRPRGWAGKMSVNFVGAIITFSVLAILFITKFTQVWPVLIFLPIVMFIFRKVNRHYEAVGEQLRIKGVFQEEIHSNVIIVPVAGITTVVERTINYAKSLSDQVIAVYVAFDHEDEKRMEEKWKEWDCGVRLVTLHSSYRSIVQPLAKFLEIIQRKAKENKYQVMVLIPQFIPKKRWQNILHNQSALLIRMRLLWEKDVVVATMPYHFKK